MRWITLASLAVISVGLAACATATPQRQLTPVVATDQGVRVFAGVWRGHVDSADERLAGDIEFRFERGGAVILLLPSRSVPSRILWIRLNDESITGALEPFFDRSRQAEVYATFDGTLSNGVLHGVLRERVHMQWSEAATWSVERVAN